MTDLLLLLSLKWAVSRQSAKFSLLIHNLECVWIGMHISPHHSLKHGGVCGACRVRRVGHALSHVTGAVQWVCGGPLFKWLLPIKKHQLERHWKFLVEKKGRGKKKKKSFTKSSNWCQFLFLQWCRSVHCYSNYINLSLWRGTAIYRWLLQRKQGAGVSILHPIL